MCVCEIVKLEVTKDHQKKKRDRKFLFWMGNPYWLDESTAAFIIYMVLCTAAGPYLCDSGWLLEVFVSKGE